MFHRMIYLNSELPLLLVNFVIGFRLELMNISLIISSRSSLTHLHGFQLLALLVYFIEIFLYQQNAESKEKFRQASNRCKRVPGAAKLAHDKKTQNSQWLLETSLSGFLMNC